MTFLSRLFGKKPASAPEDHAPARGATPSSASSKATSSAVRLANPAHPARERLDKLALAVQILFEVEVAGNRTVTKLSAPAGTLETLIVRVDEAIAACPGDLDLLVAKAAILHSSGQFKSAETALDIVLSQDPDHFEAKAWKQHWDTWIHALRFPRWDETLQSVHPVMASHLALDHRVQLVRDGLQKTLSIVAPVQGPPFDRRTEVKVQWVLSETPDGPLIAYYVKLIEPSGEPSTMEAFLPMFRPTLFSPMEGCFLVSQLAFTPYCFVVLVNGNAVSLNRRFTLSPRASQNMRNVASRLTSSDSYLPEQKFQDAIRWHSSNFDIATVTFD